VSSFQNNKYRDDIDGLRTIAVIAVFIFHAGFLPNGYLGVDIFFVISGYLITRILSIGRQDQTLTISEFYIKRIRRIIPLVLFFCLISLIIGSVVMLPDDLENLSQSTIATVFFSNNILLCITTQNYWEVLNEFKPLMHTWSLGIEEQFYIIYPFVIYLIPTKRKLLFFVLLSITLLSAYFYFTSDNSAYTFYLLPFRFYELAMGGLVAILLVYNQIYIRLKFLLLLPLLYLLIIGLPIEFTKLQIPLICANTMLLLITSDKNKLCDKILQNKVMRSIGKISFSIYMWHQFLFAFTRYFIVQEISISTSVILFIITIVLSILSYYIIETPFRNKKTVSNLKLFFSLGLTTILILGISFTIYLKAGLLKDFPELNKTTTNIERNMHAKYVNGAKEKNGHFNNPKKTNILVYGNSFASDWTNVLRESVYNDSLSVICISNIERHIDLAKKADFIFLSSLAKSTSPTMDRSDTKDLSESIQNKLWCVGTKNFGISNGIFYNYRGEDYCLQRTKMEKGYLEENNKLRLEWGEKYIDLINILSDKNKAVPVFTPDCKFISEDTRHLTKPGAQYLASLLKNQLQVILFESPQN